jgi:hypothetical protein
MTTPGRQFNCLRDQPDPRDFHFTPASTSVAPPAVDLRSAPDAWPAIFDQGHLNSCTANAIAAVLAYDIRRDRRSDTFVPSRLFIYYNERYREDAVGLPEYGDHGAPAYMRDCIQVIDASGFCSESEWPYDQSRFDTKPPDVAYASALAHRACDYRRIAQDVTQMKACLAEGYPFVCGIVVCQSFTTDVVHRTGIVPVPSDGERHLGGHALAVVGYDDLKQWFIVRNSLGASWGDQGHGYLPYAFLSDPRYAMDFWVVRRVQTNVTALKEGTRSASISTPRASSVFLADTPATLDLVPALTQTFTCSGASGALTAPLWVSDVGCFVFGDDKAVYGFSDSCQPLWTLTAQYKLNGWTVAGSDLYVQDGCVLTQYDMNGLVAGASPHPENGFNFKTRTWWSSQKSAGTAKDALFTGCSGDDLIYSRPIVLSVGPAPTLRILSGSGMLIPLPADLQVDGTKVFQSSDPPENPELFFISTAGKNTLRYLSHGQVAILDADVLATEAKQLPEGGGARWLGLMRIATAPVPSIKLTSPGVAWTAWASSISDPDEAPRLLLAVVGPGPQCGIALLDRPTGQFRISAGRLASSESGSGVNALLASPCAIAEGGAIFVYALTGGPSSTVQFQKFKLPRLVAADVAVAVWALFDAQFQAVRRWAEGTGAPPAPLPFDDSATTICLAAALAATGISPTSLESSLQSAASQGSSSILTSLRAAGYSLIDAASALRFVTGLTAKQMLVALQGCGLQPSEFVPAVASLYGLAGSGLDSVLKDAGLSFNAIASSMRASGLGADALLRWFTCVSVDDGQIVGAALQSAGYTAAEAAVGLIANKWNTPLAVQILVDGYQLWDREAVAVLQSAGYK